MKIKKLSEYEALEGLTVMGKLSRAVSPFAKNKKFMDKLRGCIANVDESDLGQRNAALFVDMIELITSDAPELLIDIISVMSGEDRKKVAKSNLLVMVDALIELREDEQLASFLSKRFSLAARKQQSISTTTEDSVQTEQSST